MAKHALARSLASFLIAAVIASVLALSVATAHAELDPVVYDTWGVGGVDDLATQNYRAEVWDFEQIGDVMYVGGKFTSVKSSFSDVGYPLRYLAAFDVHTGDWIDSFPAVAERPGLRAG